MATESASDGTSVTWYRERIGEPSTDDEAVGYWLFAAGVVLGFLSIPLFIASTPVSGLRQLAILLGMVGLVLLLAGPIIRLPLQRRATRLVYLGAAISGLGALWFLVAYPVDWTIAEGNPAVIATYSLGLLVMAVGGVVVPILTDRADLEAERSALEAELSELRNDLADTEADETDMADRVREFRQQLADAEADEADLAAQLRSLRTSQSRFELYEDAGGEYRWRLRHRNGNVIATSGEGYTRRHNARKGMAGVRRDALGATVLTIESEAELAEEGETFEPVEEVESQATFELEEDAGGEYRWRLRHDNGNVLADGGEGYTRRDEAVRAIDRVREHAAAAEYLRADPTAIEVYRDNAGEWRWRLVHKNGNVLADGGEGYTRRRDARRAIDAVRENVDDHEFEVFEDARGEHRWRLRASNGETVADGGEGYGDRAAAEDAVDRARDRLPEADLLDIGWAAFEVYEDASGEYRWRLRHRNGNVIADGGEGYGDRSSVYDAIESVKRNAPNADVEA